MISGVVTTDREAIVRLAVFGKQSQQERISAVVDSGFTGFLSLPRSMIHDLELPWLTESRAILGDGNEVVFDVFRATVNWDRRRIDIIVHAAETTPLIGMSLLEGFEFTMQVRQDGPVLIKRMKPPSKKPRRQR